VTLRSSRLVWLAWAALHLAVAFSLMLAVVDWPELIDPWTFPAICEDFIEKRVDWGVFSAFAFAARCWDPSEAEPFFALALVGATVILSPFTVGIIVMRRCRSSRVVVGQETSANDL